MLQGGFGDHLRLVEAALCLLAGMERDRDNGDGSHGHYALKFSHRLSQYSPQNGRSRPNLLELEQMNQVAQFAAITAVGDGPLKWRIGALTQQAARLAIGSYWIDARRPVQRLTANRAVRTQERSECEQTGSTYGEARNSEQWGTTDTAIGGKESEE